MVLQGCHGGVVVPGTMSHQIEGLPVGQQIAIDPMNVASGRTQPHEEDHDRPSCEDSPLRRTRRTHEPVAVSDELYAGDAGIRHVWFTRNILPCVAARDASIR